MNPLDLDLIDLFVSGQLTDRDRGSFILFLY